MRGRCAFGRALGFRPNSLDKMDIKRNREKGRPESGTTKTVVSNAERAQLDISTNSASSREGAEAEAWLVDAEACLVEAVGQAWLARLMRTSSRAQIILGVVKVYH